MEIILTETVAEIDAEIDRLNEKKRTIWPKKFSISLERNIDEADLLETGESYGFDGVELDRFIRTCKHELEAILEVHKDGSVFIVAIESSILGHKLSVNS